MGDYLKSLFANKAIVDEREALYTFTLPNVDGTFGLFAPDPTAWTQLALVRRRGFMYIYIIY